MFWTSKRKWTAKAFAHGKREHKFGRVIAWPIVVGMIYNYFWFDLISLILFILTFACWIIYLASHTFEKKCFKKAGGGPRG